MDQINNINNRAAVYNNYNIELLKTLVSIDSKMNIETVRMFKLFVGKHIENYNIDASVFGLGGCTLLHWVVVEYMNNRCHDNIEHFFEMVGYLLRIGANPMIVIGDWISTGASAMACVRDNNLSGIIKLFEAYGFVAGHSKGIR